MYVDAAPVTLLGSFPIASADISLLRLTPLAKVHACMYVVCMYIGCLPPIVAVPT
eukprot:COSAG01_NODE_16974_length_1189_cov_1.030275_2_plen_55_part_00